jgi:hypothetical protein
MADEAGIVNRMSTFAERSDCAHARATDHRLLSAFITDRGNDRVPGGIDQRLENAETNMPHKSRSSTSCFSPLIGRVTLLLKRAPSFRFTDNTITGDIAEGEPAQSSDR